MKLSVELTAKKTDTLYPILHFLNKPIIKLASTGSFI